MKMILLILFFFLPVTLFAHETSESAQPSPSTPLCESSQPGEEIDMECIDAQLKGDGLGGWVHASVGDQMVFVFTWRKPGSFFVNVQLPMFSEDPKVLDQLKNLRRHDQVILKGKFFNNEAPLNHINVTEVVMVKAFQGPFEDYEYDPTLLPEILQNNTMIAKVHIVANGGRVLVVEKDDRVLPVFNDKPNLTKDLFRNDKIELHYNVRLLPQSPNHIQVDTSLSNPIRVLESIADGHGEPFELTGPLVMFPQSPQIIFNVFAIRQEDGDGIHRNFTVINFEDMDLFEEMRLKFQEAWDQAVSTAKYDRNKYINRKIQVTVRGLKNVVSSQQANPQIVPEKISDIEITFL